MTNKMISKGDKKEIMRVLIFLFFFRNKKWAEIPSGYSHPNHPDLQKKRRTATKNNQVSFFCFVFLLFPSKNKKDERIKVASRGENGMRAACLLVV
jgi:hypothetical protein